MGGLGQGADHTGHTGIRNETYWEPWGRQLGIPGARPGHTGSHEEENWANWEWSTLGALGRGGKPGMLGTLGVGTGHTGSPKEGNWANWEP